METKQLIFEKIPLIMKEVWVVWKNKNNTQQWYKFRGIDDMYNALNKTMSENKVFITSEVLERIREEKQSKNWGTLIYTTLRMKFKFYAEDWSYVESTTEWEAMDSWDKSTNKAMSVAYKYALMQIFCIPTEEEKDTELQSPEIATKPQEKPQTNSLDHWVCNKCNAPMVKSPSTWKVFCSAKCWLN